MFSITWNFGRHTVKTDNLSTAYAMLYAAHSSFGGSVVLADNGKVIARLMAD